MWKLFLAAAWVLMASGAQAATLNVVNGQLMGASGVLVDGSLYDVQFLDGTCFDLYNGCDEVSDFTFQTEASAILASQALLDQVFVDGPEGNFDSTPSLTNGCAGHYWCLAVTPYDQNWPLPTLSAIAAANGIDAHLNGVGLPGEFAPDYVSVGAAGIASNVDLSSQDLVHLFALGYFTVDYSQGNLLPGIHFMLWSPVPEPSTALLLGIGLVGMAARRHPRR